MTNSDGSGQDVTSTDEVRSALQAVLKVLSSLSDLERKKLLRTAATFFEVDMRGRTGPVAVDTESARASHTFSFAEERDVPPKEFMADKQPHTDVERMACLAYYLTHFRATPHFKTLDLSILNTEAAQIKFSNAAVAVGNATKRGFLAAAGKGTKQITAEGEEYVTALPDREAAAAAMSRFRSRRKRGKKKARRRSSKK